MQASDPDESAGGTPQQPDLQRLLQASSLGIALAGGDGRITFVSQGLAELLDQPAHQLIGLPATELMSESGSAPAAWGVVSFTREVRRRQREGAERSLLFVVCPLQVEEAVEGYFLLAIDRSHQQRNEAARAQERTLEAVSRLAGGVAHGFNNMLAVILGYSELMLDTVEAPSPLRMPLEEVRRAATRGATLARHLLSFSRGSVAAPETLDLGELVRERSEELQRELGAAIELVVAVGSGGAPVRINTALLGQVLEQLITNARDAMADGGRLIIQVGRLTVPEDGPASRRLALGDYVTLEVTDTGCGMDEETRSHVFEPFFTTRGPSHSSGLGLATVHGIVLQNGGAIEVDSAPAAGTTVRIYLPRWEGAPMTRRPSILLVEDDEQIREGLMELLEAEGYEIHAAVDGVEALNLLQTEVATPQVIVTDLQMPRANGWVFALELQKDARYAQVPLVVVSGAHDAREAGQFLGAAAAFQKPVNIPEFLDTLERLASTV